MNDRRDGQPAGLSAAASGVRQAAQASPNAQDSPPSEAIAKGPGTGRLGMAGHRAGCGPGRQVVVAGSVQPASWWRLGGWS